MRTAPAMSARTAAGLALAAACLAGCAPPIQSRPDLPAPEQVTPQQWAAGCEPWDEWDKPAPPFKVYGNTYYVGTINRVGKEEYGENDFYGESYFCDPKGQFVGDVGSDQDEELIIRDLDLDVIQEVRDTWHFYFNRRPDQYGPLVQETVSVKLNTQPGSVKK